MQNHIKAREYLNEEARLLRRMEDGDNAGPLLDVFALVNEAAGECVINFKRVY